MTISTPRVGSTPMTTARSERSANDEASASSKNSPKNLLVKKNSTEKVTKVTKEKVKRDGFCVLRPGCKLPEALLSAHKYEVFGFDCITEKEVERKVYDLWENQQGPEKEKLQIQQTYRARVKTHIKIYSTIVTTSGAVEVIKTDFLKCKKGPARTLTEEQYWEIVYKNVLKKGYYLPRPDHEYFSSHHPIKSYLKDPSTSLFVKAVRLSEKDLDKVATTLPRENIRWQYLKIVKPKHLKDIFINKADWITAPKGPTSQPIEKALYEKSILLLEPGTKFPEEVKIPDSEIFPEDSSDTEEEEKVYGDLHHPEEKVKFDGLPIVIIEGLDERETGDTLPANAVRTTYEHPQIVLEEKPNDIHIPQPLRPLSQSSALIPERSGEQKAKAATKVSRKSMKTEVSLILANENALTDMLSSSAKSAEEDFVMPLFTELAGNP